MRIGIIGAGNVGRALAGAFTRAGHAVTLSARRPEHAAEVAGEVGAAAAGSPGAAAANADMVVLAVPFDSVRALAAEFGDQFAGRVVIDATNRFDPRALDGTSNAEAIQTLLPEARVVKAVNTLFAANMAQAVLDGTPLDGFLAGDDADAKARVADLLREIGFRPIDTGPLVMARALEAMALLNIQLNMANGWVWRTGWKLLGPTTGA